MTRQTHPGSSLDDGGTPSKSYKKGLIILAVGVIIGAFVAGAVSMVVGHGGSDEKGKSIQGASAVVPAISPPVVPEGSNPWAQWEAKQQLQQPQQQAQQTQPPLQSNGTLLFSENTSAQSAVPGAQVTQMITPAGQSIELMPGSTMSTTASGYPVYTSGSPKAIDQLSDPGLPDDPSHAIGRNGLQGNPCVDPSSTFGRAYDRKQGY